MTDGEDERKREVNTSKRRLRKVSSIHCLPFASLVRRHDIRRQQKVSIPVGKEPFLCDGGWLGWDLRGEGISPGSSGRKGWWRES